MRMIGWEREREREKKKEKKRKDNCYTVPGVCNLIINF